MYLTTRDLTSWSQPYHNDTCTKQLHSVWILPVNYKRIMNRHARRIDPRVDKLVSETHGPSCSDYRVAWDFDSPWITGPMIVRFKSDPRNEKAARGSDLNRTRPMTAHQSVAYVRHIKLAPAANLCTLSAIVFLPIKAWIWRHIRRYLDGSAIFCWLSTDPYDPDDQRFRHASRRKLYGVKRHFDKMISVCDKLSISSNYIFQA